MRIGIFIDHDIMIRHFILSGVFDDIVQHHDVEFVFPNNVPKRISTKLDKLNLGCFEEIEVNLERVYRLNRLSTIALVRSLARRSGKDRVVIQKKIETIVGHRALSIYKVLCLPGIFELYVRIQRVRNRGDNEIRTLLRRKKFDVLVHPTTLRGIFVNDLIKLGREEAVPTMFLMNSWDNPSTKAIVAGYPDRLLVWGEQTKNHAIKFMGVPRESIVISGAAQFQIYRTKPEIDRPTFRKMINLEGSEKLVMYAGSSKGLNEMSHLLTLDRAVSQLGVDCKILYRPHPWKAPNSKEKTFGEYGFTNVIFDPFSWDNYISIVRGSERIDVFSSRYAETNILLKAIDGLFAPVTTLLIEAAMNKVPIVMVDLPEDQANSDHHYISSNRVQYQEMRNLLQPYICRDDDHFPSALRYIVECSREPKTVLTQLSQNVSYIVGNEENSYADILLRTIEEFR